MKKLDLEQMGVQEMGAVEVKGVDGGIIGVDDVGWVIGMLGSSEFWEGWVMDTFH